MTKLKVIPVGDHYAIYDGETIVGTVEYGPEDEGWPFWRVHSFIGGYPGTLSKVAGDAIKSALDFFGREKRQAA